MQLSIGFGFSHDGLGVPVIEERSGRMKRRRTVMRKNLLVCALFALLSSVCISLVSCNQKEYAVVFMVKGQVYG